MGPDPRFDRGACIYCGATGVPFNRDHVVPEAFGKFKNNFVIKCVCTSCNQFFGDEFEIVLGRNSREAILRMQHGLKAPTKSADLKYDRAQLMVSEPGPWRGARIVLASDAAGTKLDTRPVPQIAFRSRKQDEWVWFSEAQLADPSLFDAYRSPDSQIQVVGSSKDDVDRLIARLESLGIHFNQHGALPQPTGIDGTILATLTSKTDETVLRAVGKIAFNYVAYTKGATFVLRQDFDQFRSWVRTGTLPGWGSPVHLVPTPILADDSAHWRQTTGHLISFDWTGQRQGLLAQVSLFNDLTYKVLICVDYSGLFHDLRVGHHFDLESHKISKLTPTTLYSS